MFYQPIALAALSLLGLSTAVPVPDPVTAALPASPELQNSIISLELNLVYLINDFVQSNVAGAKNDYYSAQAKFVQLGQAVSDAYSCDSPSYGGRIETQKEAIDALHTSQDNLAQLSLDLQNSNSPSKTIDDDFCAAYTSFQRVDYYTFNILAAPVKRDLDLAGAYTDSLVALEAVIATLNVLPEGAPASDAARTAWKNAQSKLGVYQSAANPSGSVCPPSYAYPATDKYSAVSSILRAELAVQDVFADTRAQNGEAFGDFCNIDAFMAAVNAFIGA
jgi:hypothetical protein